MSSYTPVHLSTSFSCFLSFQLSNLPTVHVHIFPVLFSCLFFSPTIPFCLYPTITQNQSLFYVPSPYFPFFLCLTIYLFPFFPPQDTTLHPNFPSFFPRLSCLHALHLYISPVHVFQFFLSI